MLMNERRLIVVPVLPVGSTLLLVHGGQILVLGVRYKVNRVEDVGQSTNALESADFVNFIAIVTKTFSSFHSLLFLLF